jgi:hypothetical protein
LCALKGRNRSVTICSPANGRDVNSSVNIQAGTTDRTPVKLMQVFVDGNKIYEAPLSAIDIDLLLSKGSHLLTVDAIDVQNVSFGQTIIVRVNPHE